MDPCHNFILITCPIVGHDIYFILNCESLSLISAEPSGITAVLPRLNMLQAPVLEYSTSDSPNKIRP
jgi:hypothetical protein